MLVAGGTIVNEGTTRKGFLLVEDDHIKDISYSDTLPHEPFDTIIDATGCIVMPGVIDTHVHFREPGLTHKADLESESRAAAVGGVTSFFDMPNTLPQTTTHEALNDKLHLARQKSHVNYAFYAGATRENHDFLASLDTRHVAGVKVFMGASTGDMLVDDEEALSDIFRIAKQKGLILMAHCEDSATIRHNMEEAKRRFHTDDPPIACHPNIRSAEACLVSARRGKRLAQNHGTRFHIAHLSTADELSLLGEETTGEVCLAHLLFDENDYDRLEALIKCNPAVKNSSHRQALIRAVKDGLVSTIATDHAPHTLNEKQGGSARALSGMPLVQYSLAAMLTLAQEEDIPTTRIVELMCHNPARLFSIHHRGFLRKGYKADIAILRPTEWVVERDTIESKCGWSPLEGRKMTWRVVHTILNGQHIYDNGHFSRASRGEEIEFDRT